MERGQEVGEKQGRKKGKREEMKRKERDRWCTLPPSTQRTLMEALLLYGVGEKGHQYLTEVSAHQHLWNPC